MKIEPRAPLLYWTVHGLVLFACLAGGIACGWVTFALLDQLWLVEIFTAGVAFYFVLETFNGLTTPIQDWLGKRY